MSSIPHTLPQFLWHFARRHQLRFLGLITVALLWACYLSLIPYALKLIIDRVATTEAKALFAAILFPACLYVGLDFAMGCVLRFYDWLLLQTFPTMKSEITEAMFEYVEKHSYS